MRGSASLFMSTWLTAGHDLVRADSGLETSQIVMLPLQWVRNPDQPLDKAISLMLERTHYWYLESTGIPALGAGACWDHGREAWSHTGTQGPIQHIKKTAGQDPGASAAAG